MVQVRWRLLASRQDGLSYRRTLIGTWPPGEVPARFYYSVQARLLPNMDIELEHLTSTGATPHHRSTDARRRCRTPLT